MIQITRKCPHCGSIDLVSKCKLIHPDGYKGIRTDLKKADDDFRIYDTRTDAREAKDLAGSNLYFDGLQK